MRYADPSLTPLWASEPDQVGAYEAKTHLPRLLDAVADGAQVVITKHGHPVARLVPVVAAGSVGAIARALREDRVGVELGGALRPLIDAGRR